MKFRFFREERIFTHFNQLYFNFAAKLANRVIFRKQLNKKIFQKWKLFLKLYYNYITLKLLKKH